MGVEEQASEYRSPKRDHWLSLGSSGGNYREEGKLATGQFKSGFSELIIYQFMRDCLYQAVLYILYTTIHKIRGQYQLNE